MELHQLKRIIEAALLASAQPLTLPQISGLFDEFAMPSQEDLAQAVAELQADADGRGVELVEVASGFRYQIRQDVHAFVSKLWTERQTRYSRALLETLALIAYRQPITRAEIEQIRGVAVSTNIIRTLEERDWVRVVGYRDLPGKPALFGTTKQFLDYFSLKSLDQLPALSEIRDLEEPESQLALGDNGEAIPANVEVDDTDEAQPGAEDGEDGEDGSEAETASEAAEAADADAEPGDETVQDEAGAESESESESGIETEADTESPSRGDDLSAEESGADGADAPTPAVEEDADTQTARAESSPGATSGNTTEPVA
ncbi:SMC-Scp complex subunit ScpB [Dokdonella ginsengisoli]|uniref:SMC-Scp complex subunit ScpB n=1 Tax=Dokdonella ginsengisoli TaxID=363846 RepID=A0ABV9QVX3_9GAMM